MSTEAIIPPGKKTATIVRYPGQRILVGDSTVVRVIKIEGARVYVQIETDVNAEIKRPAKEEDILDRKMSGVRNEQTLTFRNTKK